MDGDMREERPPAGTLAGPETWPPAQGDLGFHYSRAERLRTAPQSVRDYYSGRLQPVRGFKVLVANRANRFMLIAMLVVFAATFAVMLLGRKDNAAVISGVSATLGAFRFDGQVYVSLELKPQKQGTAPQLRLDAEFSAVNADGQVADIYTGTCFFTGTGSFLRTTFADYDIMSVSALVSDGKEQVPLRCTVMDR